VGPFVYKIMHRQKTRTHATLACINCRRRHEKCERIPEEDICTNCKEYNRLCVSIPGNSSCGATQTHTQYQLTTGIEYSCLTSGVCTQYQLTPSIESYSCLIPEKYQEQLMLCSLGGLYPVSGTTE
ncbi:1114_t:CDS:1, partial [Cetraspora pellucida]